MPNPTPKDANDLDRTALLKLAERVEKASGPDRVLDMAIYLGYTGSMSRIPAYTRSLDAAMTLVPEGCTVSLSLGRVAIAGVHIISDDPLIEPVDNEATAPGAALALTSAALRARAATQQAPRKAVDGRRG